MLERIIEWLIGMPPGWVYLIVGVGAALENVVPPVPADTFVVLGGFLASQGRAEPIGVFLATWGANVISALLVYGVGARYGSAFFGTRLGNLLLRPHQLERMGAFYNRWGRLTIFLTRFLPGFRAVVPVFAGVTHQRLLPVAVPLIVASAIWYGFLTWLGAFAGRNLETILGWLGGLNRVLVLVALTLGAALLAWWLRSRSAQSSRHTE